MQTQVALRIQAACNCSCLYSQISHFEPATYHWLLPFRIKLNNHLMSSSIQIRQLSPFREFQNFKISVPWLVSVRAVPESNSIQCKELWNCWSSLAFLLLSSKPWTCLHCSVEPFFRRLPIYLSSWHLYGSDFLFWVRPGLSWLHRAAHSSSRHRGRQLAIAWATLVALIIFRLLRPIAIRNRPRFWVRIF